MKHGFLVCFYDEHEYSIIALTARNPLGLAHAP